VGLFKRDSERLPVVDDLKSRPLSSAASERATAASRAPGKPVDSTEIDAVD
jgi:hypothetical protein